MGTWDSGGAIDKDEDHAAKRPGDAQKADAIAGTGLLDVADDSSDGDVQEEKGGYELNN